MARLVVSVLITILASTAYSSEKLLVGDVIKVIDGDTIDILDSSDKQTRIRLAGIDCPEKGHPWGDKATNALKSILSGDQVTVKVIDTDRYGRSVGRVYYNDINVNQKLVQTGNCWVYPKYARDPALFDLQEAARKNRLGLWSLFQTKPAQVSTKKNTP